MPPVPLALGMLGILDIIGIAAIVLVIVSLSMPAKVEIKDRIIYFSVWPFIARKPKRIEELESYRIQKGMFPIILKFKDGTIYKWTSFPLGRHDKLKNELDEFSN